MYKLMPTRRIGLSDVEVPVLGFGGAGIGNLYRAIDDETAASTVHAALNAGMQFIDTAPHYGQGLSEQRIGRVLTQLVSKPVLSTKVGRVLNPIVPPPTGTERHGFVDGLPYEPEFDYTYDGVMRSFDSSLQRLQVDRVDILLAHDVGQITHGNAHELYWKQFVEGGFRAMQRLKEQGVVRALGLGVNESQVCVQALQTFELDVLLLAGRYTLLEQHPLETLFPLCESKNVSIVLGGPFNSGILIDGVRGTAVPYYNYAPATAEVIERVQAIQRVCESHSVPMAAAALQFPLAHKVVVSVIPGQASVEQVNAIKRWFDTEIPDVLWSDLQNAGLLRRDAPLPSSRSRG